jgi:hypothetical protein
MRFYVVSAVFATENQPAVSHQSGGGTNSMGHTLLCFRYRWNTGISAVGPNRVVTGGTECVSPLILIPLILYDSADARYIGVDLVLKRCNTAFDIVAVIVEMR